MHRPLTSFSKDPHAFLPDLVILDLGPWMLKLPAVVLVTVGLAAALGGCGGTSKGTAGASTSSASATSSAATATTSASAATGQGSSSQSLAADPSGQLGFTKTSLTAKAGKVTIRFTNASGLQHNLTVQQGTSGSVLGATATFQGGTKNLVLTLKPGTYTFFCSVPGHRAAGMEGTLVVR